MLGARTLKVSFAGFVAARAGSRLGATTAASQSFCLVLREMLRVTWGLGVTAATVHLHFHRVA